tara:strand:+ start:782 stop:1435 length:654 start_codon:yes stop_codon:yes gene_type:complete
MSSTNLYNINVELNKAITFLSNFKNNQSKFTNIWNNDIENIDNYNNISKTMPFFWLNNNIYKINIPYSFILLKNIPWYFDFELYSDINNDKNLWSNFNEWNNSNNLHYIANENKLIEYIPRGYLIPPVDKNILNIKFIKDIEPNDDDISYSPEYETTITPDDEEEKSDNKNWQEKIIKIGLWSIAIIIIVIIFVYIFINYTNKSNDPIILNNNNFIS